MEKYKTNITNDDITIVDISLEQSNKLKNRLIENQFKSDFFEFYIDYRKIQNVSEMEFYTIFDIYMGSKNWDFSILENHPKIIAVDILEQIVKFRSIFFTF